MHDYDRTNLYIDGAWVPSTGGETVPVIDPATEQTIGSVPAGTAADVDAAVAAARRAFDPLITVDERRDRLRTIISAMESRLDDLAETIGREMGAPLKTAQTVQTKLGVVAARGIMKTLDEYEFEERVGNSLLVREPYGVVGAITPWNYPITRSS